MSAAIAHGLGGGHCCICSRICHHIGGPWFCDEHKAEQSFTVPAVPALPPFARLKLLDLNAVRRHVAEYRRAWAESSDVTETRRTLAALLCAEDLAVLLDHLDGAP